MKKSSFTALILGTVSAILFALGMCMALLPEWNSLTQGIIFGTSGIVLGLITWLIWRKMEHKKPIRLNVKGVLLTLYGIVGALALGVGMCFSMLWSSMTVGIIIGIIGIVMLISLIPIIKGIK